MNHEPAFGCRWAVIREKQEEDPPIMAEDDEGSFVLYEHFAHLQQQLAAMTRERDELKYRLQVMADTVGEENFSLRQQLSASQARCRELEREIKSLTTCGCEGCDDNLEESAFCFPCMNKVQQQVTQLQATLAAREARIAELVEGLRTIAYADWSPELNKEISAAMERGELKHMTGVEWLAQRLLTQLEAHRREG